MNLARSYQLLCLLVLTGCRPEVVELVHFAGDAGDDGDLDDSAPEAGIQTDAGLGSELDARVRPDVDAGAQPRVCASNEECGKYEYCFITGCTAKRGVCSPRPLICPGEASPVQICGCDGLVYFNDCLRALHGESLDPTCLAVRPCGSTSPCPEPAYCSNLYRDRSSCRQGPAERACWVIPSQCALTAGGDQFMPCDSSGTDSPCVSACEAIRSTMPYARVQRSCGPPGTGIPGSGFMP